MATIKKSVPVTGMSCASCAASIQNALKGQKGIKTIDVNYANATALVEYEEVETSIDKIAQTVQALGYGLVYDEEVTAEDIEKKQLGEYRKLQTKTTLALIFATPLVIISMFFMGIPYCHYILWGLSTPVVFYFGLGFFVRAWNRAKHMSANMDTLVALSTGIAYVFSVFNTLFPKIWTDKGLEAPVYFEAAAVVIAFILLGKLLEEKARFTTSSAIKKLMGLQPETVFRMNGEEEEEIALKDVVVGDVLIARPGEKIAVDGVVVAGHSFVNEAMITGEPLAAEKNEGSKVFAGTLNQKGHFKYHAEKVGNATLLAQIIKKVQQAQGSKAPVQQLTDKIASIFVPVVLAIAVVTFIAWLVIGGTAYFNQGLLSMITVLVVACPCALGLATPTAIIAGMGKGAENGILIKDAVCLEALKKVDAVVFDKTGTITEGMPMVVDIYWKNPADTNQNASIFLGLEMLSEHPIGEAISKFFKDLHIAPTAVSSFTSITGSGVTAVHERNIYFAGNVKLIQSMGIKIEDRMKEKMSEWSEKAYTIVILANQFTTLAALAVSDKIKVNSKFAVARLKDMGIETYMLTGDNEITAYSIAQEAGISNYKAEASPSDKSLFIQELQQKGKVVAMVGDGINDSLALAQADVSVAMGSGTDVAMEVAQLTLMSSDLQVLPNAIYLSRKTVSTIHQNLFWAFFYNVIMIPVAAGVLFPFNGFTLNPMIAGGAMALSSVSVVLSSLRLKWMKL